MPGRCHRYVYSGVVVDIGSNRRMGKNEHCDVCEMECVYSSEMGEPELPG